MKTKTRFAYESWKQSNKLTLLPLGMVVLCVITARISAQTYSVLHTFAPGGSYARLALSGETLYGTTYGSGLNYGTVFKVNTDGSGSAVIRAFTWGPGEGQRPAAGVLLSGGGLYCSTQYGMTNNGQLFWIGTNGYGFTVLKYFNGLNGAGPLGLILSGDSLYGTTRWGGYAGTPGTIFRISTNGGDHAILHDFYHSNEYFPTADLVLSDGVFYGTTTGSGTVIKGSVFRMNTDGSNYRVLKKFTNETGTDGLNPEAGLALSGTTLYGTTSLGGLSGRGTIFKVETDGSGFTVLKHFNGGDGENPKGSLLLVGSTLFGTTEGGGAFNRGTIFKLDTDGSDLLVLKNFIGGDGGYPCAALLLSGTNLYGTTRGRIPGEHNPAEGVVFSMTLTPPVITTEPRSRTAEIGSSVTFASESGGFPIPECHWFINGVKVGNSSMRGLLELTNIQTYQAGACVAVFANAVGSVTSTPALLNVIAAVERRPVPGFLATGEAGSSLNIEYIDTFVPVANWLTLDTVTMAGTSQWCFDLSAALSPQRFYRASQNTIPASPPLLSLNMIPAITLTGSPGNKVRVDSINAIGPTDAWFTLDTVVLTNASQLYFDVSAPGQPQRLYRLVDVP